MIEKTFIRHDCGNLYKKESKKIEFINFLHNFLQLLIISIFKINY